MLASARYNVETMWRCEWETIKSRLDNKTLLEYKAQDQHINIRDALFGGQTEGFKSKVQRKSKDIMFALYIPL